MLPETVSVLGLAFAFAAALAVVLWLYRQLLAGWQEDAERTDERIRLAQGREITLRGPGLPSHLQIGFELV
jgi:hypothetical protein